MHKGGLSVEICDKSAGLTRGDHGQKPLSSPLRICAPIRVLSWAGRTLKIWSYYKGNEGKVVFSSKVRQSKGMHATHMILPKRTINRIDERTYLLMRYLYRFILPLENSFFRQFFHSLLISYMYSWFGWIIRNSPTFEDCCCFSKDWMFFCLSLSVCVWTARLYSVSADTPLSVYVSACEAPSVRSVFYPARVRKSLALKTLVSAAD